jgi:hypothetical protein
MRPRLSRAKFVLAMVTAGLGVCLVSVISTVWVMRYRGIATADQQSKALVDAMEAVPSPRPLPSLPHAESATGDDPSFGGANPANPTSDPNATVHRAGGNRYADSSSGHNQNQGKQPRADIRPPAPPEAFAPRWPRAAVDLDSGLVFSSNPPGNTGR